MLTEQEKDLVLEKLSLDCAGYINVLEFKKFRVLSDKDAKLLLAEYQNKKVASLTTQRDELDAKIKSVITI
jgi:hypothetical protein